MQLHKAKISMYGLL